MSVNEIQIGGDHYKISQYQHWDWVIDVRLPYLEGNATKYLSRWRNKNGVLDLEKAEHYVAKIRESFLAGRHWNSSLLLAGGQDLIASQVKTQSFLETLSDATAEELFLIEMCAAWKDESDLSFLLARLSAFRQGVAACPTQPKFKAPPEPAYGARHAGERWPHPTGHPAPFGYNPEDEE